MPTISRLAGSPDGLLRLVFCSIGSPRFMCATPYRVRRGDGMAGPASRTRGPRPAAQFRLLRSRILAPFSASACSRVSCRLLARGLIKDQHNKGRYRERPRALGETQMNAMRLPADGTFVGRVRSPGSAHPQVVTVRDGQVIDITSASGAHRPRHLRNGRSGGLCAWCAGRGYRQPRRYRRQQPERERQCRQAALLAPIDLQAVKASGVTFVVSLLERVIEEQARGDAGKAPMRSAPKSQALIGDNLSRAEARLARGHGAQGRCWWHAALWSQYLEVGIGPDAEIFTKCQPMSSVGFGADVGLHPVSTWNNPEPEIVLVASSAASIVGATLGNDVNLRDVEGRSRAAARQGQGQQRLGADRPVHPPVRRHVLARRRAQKGGRAHRRRRGRLRARGRKLDAPRSAATRLDLVAADDAAGTTNIRTASCSSSAPCSRRSKDRGAPGQGFTHHVGDVVTISTATLGALVNTVRLSPDCPHWTYGMRALMKDLSGAGLV